MIHFNFFSAGSILLLISASLALNGCREDFDEADAFGNFEATPVFISPDVSGKILWLSLEEGAQLDSGQLVAILDTMHHHLTYQELLSQQKVVQARIGNVEAQAETLREQMKSLMTELNRARRLFEDGALTDQRLDELEGQKDVLASRIHALEIHKRSIEAEWDVLEQKKIQVMDQRDRCFIRNPLTGTVLEKYMERFEVATAGKPIFKLADLETLELKVYVDALKLKTVIIGDSVTVRIDDEAKTTVEIPGVVSWISSQAEFTPKIIQTKEERVNLVYAVKVLVQNDGRLKIGLPGEVVFKSIPGQ